MQAQELRGAAVTGEGEVKRLRDVQRCVEKVCGHGPRRGPGTPTVALPERKLQLGLDKFRRFFIGRQRAGTRQG
jgi:hypothetical protein